MRGYYRKDLARDVTRYNYTVNSFDGIDAETNPNVLPLSYASYAYNVKIKNGMLTNGMGICQAYEKVDIPNRAYYCLTLLNMTYFRHFNAATAKQDDRILYYYNDGSILQGAVGQVFLNVLLELGDDPPKITFVSYNATGGDYLYIMTETGLMYKYDGTTLTTIANAPKTRDACVHMHRIYAAVEGEANRVVYSKTLDPSDWTVSPTAGGYIDFPDEGGKVRRVIPMRDQLFIIRDYSVFRLTAYGDQTDYVLTKIYSANSKIYADTATVCNDALVFVGEDGIFATDGYTVKKTLKKISPLIDDSTYSVGCFFNNKYYLATHIKTDDCLVGDEEQNVLKNNALIAFGLDDNSVDIMRGSEIRGFMAISTDTDNVLSLNIGNLYHRFTLAAVTDDGKMFGEPLTKHWESAYTDLGKYDKDKILRRLYISTEGSVTVTAKLDKEYSYRVYGGKNTQMVPVNKRAEKMSVAIHSEENVFRVNGLLAEFDLIKRG